VCCWAFVVLVAMKFVLLVLVVSVAAR